MTIERRTHADPAAPGVLDDAAGRPFSSIEEAIEEIRRGRMVVVCDDENRENEGDLTLAAQFATPEAINFMATHGRGPQGGVRGARERLDTPKRRRAPRGPSSNERARNPRAYIIPPMSGMPAPAPAGSFSGGSATIASVVRMFLAIEAAF